MILLVHIIIALSSLAVATFAFMKPTQTKLHMSYGFASGTFISGVLLILSGAGLMRACISGIVFLGSVSILNEFTRRKLATATENN